MSVTIIAGVPGVGLSTLAQTARRQLDSDYRLINFGDVMLEQAAMDDLAKNRSELAALSRHETRHLQRRAGEYISTAAREATILLTTHLTVKTAAGFLPGLPGEVLHDLSPSQFVLVEAQTATIQNRRQESNRTYNTASEIAIEFEQDLSRTASLQYATATNVPIQHIENEGEIDEAAVSLIEVL
jgi:adenylate kinase